MSQRTVKCAACECGDCLTHGFELTRTAGNYDPLQVTRGFLDKDLDDPSTEYPISERRVRNLINPTEEDILLSLPDEITTPIGRRKYRHKEEEEEKFAARRTATPGAMPVKVLTDQVVPGVESEPTIEDATFFKESDEEKTATTKSYGTGTPIGGSPNAPAAPPVPGQPQQQQQQQQPQKPATPQQPTPTTTAQPQQVQPTPTTPPPVQPSVAPLLQEKMLEQMTASIRLKLACGIEKEFAPAVGTVVKACTSALEKAGYTIRTAAQKLSSLGHGESLVITVERQKTGALIDSKDVIARVNKAAAPEYYVAAVNIKETPTSLPPRDDMRRHIDETAQEEVMEGVHEPAPQQQNPQQPQPAQVAPSPTSNQEELMRRSLAAFEDDDYDDDGWPIGENPEISSMGTVYGKPLKADINRRLEYLRSQLRAERISTGELNELQGLAEYIAPDDVELLEAAGVPEFPEEEEPLPTKPKKRFRTTNFDKWFLKELGIKASKIANKQAFQVEEGIHQQCPNCYSNEVKNLENSDPEDGLVECVSCGCLFSL